MVLALGYMEINAKPFWGQESIFFFFLKEISIQFLYFHSYSLLKLIFWEHL